MGSAGYTWDFVIEGSPDVLNVSVETVKPPNIHLPSSYNVDYVYTLTALKRGKVRIKFYLHRPWEHDKLSLQEIILNVSVVLKS